MTTNRLGFIGIIIENRTRNAAAVNDIIGRHGSCVVARMGLPYDKKGCSVITLIVDMDTDSLGVFTGQLGQLPGVSVKSMLSKKG